MRRFWFRLAMHLGMSVKQAQASIDSREFSEWLAYDEVEPFGERRADLRSGIIAATVANVSRPKGRRVYKPKDFMPDFEKRQRKMSGVEMGISFQQFAQLHNAQVAAKKRRGGG